MRGISSAIVSVFVGAALLGLMTRLCHAEQEPRTPEQTAASALRKKGVAVHLDLPSGRIREVNANRNDQITATDLAHVAKFSELTDLSLESTVIGDDALALISNLTKIEWLNLYRTKVSDAGLVYLSGFSQLQQLPVGETQVTDAGLSALVNLKKLHYLGLRGNRISDRGAIILQDFTSLKSLHLGSTAVTDAAIDSLIKLTDLEALWLHDCAITDVGLRKLAKFKSLKKLYIQRTKTTAAEVEFLREALPECRIFWEADAA
jgi:Leucine-rich repeat (LRR) protein